jgi:hypothetical protein
MDGWIKDVERLLKSHEEYIEGDLELKENNNYLTINLCGISVFRVLNTREEIEIAKQFMPFLNLGYRYVNKNWIRIPLDERVKTSIIDRIHVVFKESIKVSIKELFGCCNSFNQCSDQQKCLHLDDRFYRGCMYRNNMREGRFFYGKNRNV